MINVQVTKKNHSNPHGKSAGDGNRDTCVSREGQGGSYSIILLLTDLTQNTCSSQLSITRVLAAHLTHIWHRHLQKMAFDLRYLQITRYLIFKHFLTDFALGINKFRYFFVSCFSLWQPKIAADFRARGHKTLPRSS